MMGVASQHNIKISQYQDFTISRFHNIKISQYQDLSYPREIQGLCGRMQQDMPTLAPHLSWHAKRIREEEQFWLKEHRKSVRGNDRVTPP